MSESQWQFVYGESEDETEAIERLRQAVEDTHMHIVHPVVIESDALHVRGIGVAENALVALDDWT